MSGPTPIFLTWLRRPASPSAQQWIGLPTARLGQAGLTLDAVARHLAETLPHPTPVIHPLELRKILLGREHPADADLFLAAVERLVRTRIPDLSIAP